MCIKWSKFLVSNEIFETRNSQNFRENVERPSQILMYFMTRFSLKCDVNQTSSNILDDIPTNFKINHPASSILDLNKQKINYPASNIHDEIPTKFLD